MCALNITLTQTPPAPGKNGTAAEGRQTVIISQDSVAENRVYSNRKIHSSLHKENIFQGIK